MLSKLRPRSVYDVMAAIACFFALAGGTAYAANTIRTGDIVDNEVFTTDVRNDNLGFGGLTHPDLGAGSVRESEVADNSLTGSDIGPSSIDVDEVIDGGLNDEDIAQFNGIVTNFLGDIDLVPARSCVERLLSGINAHADHLLLTPNSDGSDPNLSYGIEYTTSGGGDAFIKVCNPTINDINDSVTRFNLLEIDAQ